MAYSGTGVEGRRYGTPGRRKAKYPARMVNARAAGEGLGTHGLRLIQSTHIRGTAGVVDMQCHPEASDGSAQGLPLTTDGLFCDPETSPKAYHYRGGGLSAPGSGRISILGPTSAVISR